MKLETTKLDINTEHCTWSAARGYYENWSLLKSKETSYGYKSSAGIQKTVSADQVLSCLSYDFRLEQVTVWKEYFIP